MFELLRMDLLRLITFSDKQDFCSYMRSLFSMSFVAVFLIRLTYFFNKYYFFKFIAKILQLILFLTFKITYSPKISIGAGLFLPHPQNIVIGCESMGAGVTIMQSVTLGAMTLDNGFTIGMRPRIKNDVFIGAHALVLGGGEIKNNTKVKAGSTVILS